VRSGDLALRSSWTGRVELLLRSVATLTLMAVAAGALTMVEPRWR